MLGIPIFTLAIAERFLPLSFADLLNQQVSRLAFGDVSRLGLVESRRGPLRQVRVQQKIPLIDFGALADIEDGRVKILRGIERFDQCSIMFLDGRERGFDAVVLATGFKPGLRPLFPDCRHLLTREGASKGSGAASEADGLFFCSYVSSPTEQLREIGLEAEAITRAGAIQLRSG